MKTGALVFLIGMLLPLQVLACGDRNSSNEEGYTQNLLYKYFSNSMSSNDACISAGSLAPKANQELYHFIPDSSVFDSTQKVFNHLFTGSYMREIQETIRKHIEMKGTPAKQAKDKASLLFKIIKAESRRNKSKWLFQTTTIVPYAYNVKNERDWANNTDRFSRKGKRMKGCGSMVCSK